ncbi:hypothetical protein F4X86_01855 [Candidatus Saccharibacteria bacterium]|nr:hypothetical protein [Candidatus Saccharibacteria bacterium]
MEKIRSQETLPPDLPDLMEIMAMGAEIEKWRLLAEILKEPLRQEHSALLAAWPEADLSRPGWQNVIDSRGRTLRNSDGEILHITKEDGAVYAREKIVRDQNDRLTEYREAAYDNSKDDPYATNNPKGSTAYTVKYLSDSAVPDICELAYAEYVRDENSHHVNTYWMTPPEGGWRGMGHISMLKVWATREIGVKYVGDQLQSAHILEKQPIASPQPGLGPASLLMRSVAGDFTDGQLAVIRAFERLGHYQPQAKMTLTRTRSGRLRETIDRA